MMSAMNKSMTRDNERQLETERDREDRDKETATVSIFKVKCQESFKEIEKY